MGKKTKIPGLMAVVLLIAGIVLANAETDAAFFRTFDQGLGISAASAESLLKSVEIKENQDGGLYIEVVRDSEFGYRPYIGFAVEGDLSEYIVHINPVKLEKNGVYQVPIEMNLNVHQYLQLSWLKNVKNQSVLQGSITVMNFDGKVIAQEQAEVEIDYILSRITKDISGNDLVEYEFEEDLTAGQRELIETIAPGYLQRLQEEMLAKEDGSRAMLGELEEDLADTQALYERVKKEKQQLEQESSESKEALNKRIEELEAETVKLRDQAKQQEAKEETP